MTTGVQILVERVRELLEADDRDALTQLLQELQPADIAGVLQELALPDQVRMLGVLDDEEAARSLEELPYDHQVALLDELDTAKVRPVLERMSADDIVDLLREVNPEKIQALLQLFPPEDAEELRQLLRYPDDSAGGLMTPDLVSLKSSQTVQEAIETLRKTSPEAETVYYLYVTDAHRHLVGVVSLRQLIVADPNARVEDIMYTRVISVPVDMDQEEVARVLDKYDFLAVPVVDHHNRLLGVVTVDDVIDVIAEEATEDIQLMGGQEPLDEPYLDTRFRALIRKRVGWLMVLFVGQSFTSTILAHFEDTLATVIALAFFIPLLIDTGGNAGSQAATLVIRAMAVGEVNLKHLFRVLSRESLVGLTLGAVMAVATFFRAMVLGESVALGYTVALTVLLIVVTATTLGSALPLVIRRFNLDPAVASAPVITTLVDATGLIIYFQVARVLLQIV